jgi:hypothetical protein
MTATVVLTGSRSALPKATRFWKKVDHLKAVVFRVEAGDEPGDADWDFYLRPASVDDAEAWWTHFWRPSNQEWIDGTLAPAIEFMDGHWSADCRKCAGTGPKGTGCRVREGVQYDVNPCPRLLSCVPCLLDVENLYAEFPLLNGELADVSAKAEIFFGEEAAPLSSGPNFCGAWSAADGKSYECDQDLNDRQADAMFDLGFRTSSGGKLLGEGPVCDELTWSNGHYIPAAGKSPCGKVVYLSGWSTHDEVHSNRPEVHPVTSLALDMGMVGKHTRELRVGAFIDGSMDENSVGFQVKNGVAGKATYDYHIMGKDDLPASVLLRLSSAGFQPAKPAPSCVEWSDHGRCDLWLPECSLDHLFSFKVEHDTPVEVRDRCADRKIEMLWSSPNGAASISKARLGWQHADYTFKMSVEPVAPLGGVLADAAPASVASGSSRACQMPKGRYERSKLRRWYRYKVHTTADFGKARDVTWTWSPPLAGSTVPPPGSVPQGGHDRHVWMPVPDKSGDHYFHPRFEEWYEGTLRAGVAVNGNSVTWAADELEAPRPSVRIEATKAAVNANGQFTVSLVPHAEGFCGEPNRWKYEWDLTYYKAPPQASGKPQTGLKVERREKLRSPLALPAGALPLTFAPGQQATLKLTVHDQLDVETAKAEITLTAPLLEIETKTTCADPDGGSKVEERTGPWESPSGGTASMVNKTLCRHTQVRARVWAVPVGVQKVFPESSAGKVTYTWADLKVAIKPEGSAPQWKWEPLPTTWQVLHPDTPDRTIVIVPDKSVTFNFQASVTATDQYGRKATAHVTGSNDFSPLPDLVDRLNKQYKEWRPQTPTPDPERTYADPIANELAILKRNARALRAKDDAALAVMRAELLAFSHYAFTRVARERHLTYAGPPAARFSVPATSTLRVRGALDAAARGVSPR